MFMAESSAESRSSSGGRHEEKSNVHLGLYRYGEGYWVRVMTAVLAALLFMAAAAWGAQELGALTLPVKGYTLSLKNIDPSLTSVAAGTELIPLGQDSTGTGVHPPVGKGVAGSFVRSSDGTGSLTVLNASLNEGVDPTSINRVQIGGSTVSVTGALSIPIVEKLYVQSGLATLIFLVGAGVIFFYVGRKRSTVDFLVATDGEMKKVNWSTKKEVQNATMTVVGATFLIAGFLFIVDIGFQTVFRAIGVLTH
ncbi:MAG: preprotein translocase subunit SecE [Planctomycetes bacterium]|nr:preprotein translocase subunit SecE [Planctomycetota bacterium]